VSINKYPSGIRRIKVIPSVNKIEEKKIENFILNRLRIENVETEIKIAKNIEGRKGLKSQARIVTAKIMMIKMNWFSS
jgi:hypothetical protein